MIEPMKHRELTRRPREAGFIVRQGRGGHEVWTKGAESVTITQAREVSPSLVRKALKAIERSQQ